MELEQRFELAKRLLTRVRSLVERARPDLGVTIVVHSKNLKADDPVVVVTTLPSRRHQRLALMNAIVGSVLLDGGTAEGAAEMCKQDAAAVFRR